MSQIIRTLIVDDSAFVRKSVREMLSRSPYIEVVGAARDGVEALELVERLRPDVVTCDLGMPRLDGVGFVRQQMSRRRLPILILSIANENAAHAIEALEAGAVDFVQKPSALATADLLRIREELIEKVKAAANAPVTEPDRAKTNNVVSVTTADRTDIVVIGASTGGPQALRALLPRLPESFPVPILVVLHMPVGFTALYASKLNEICALEVCEAVEGEEPRSGRCLFAPAGRHLKLAKSAAGRVSCRLSMQPVEHLHRPSVDVLFQSAAETYGPKVLGVVMTGMGSDGREGSAWVKAKGGTVLTEAEESCVIYGMPRSVLESGLSDATIPLARLPEAIIERL
jgi:two-component system, chemotaxis family, protein-glutamate methylesterase/glutaminase